MPTFLRLIHSVFVVLSGCFWAQSPSAIPSERWSIREVNAPDGSFIGSVSAAGAQFLGIPYAEPPLGDLRWASPKALQRKPHRRIAQHFGADCLQPDPPSNDPQPGMKMKGSEDCLFLNIFAPASGKTAKPVMVWIHGGAFVFNSGREIDPRVIVAKQDVIVVTLNYRLGAFGFLSHPELGEASGNFGLLDQQMALAWVRRNIAAFGGDAKRVTIFGESAGGVSVCMQLLSPAAKGLFDQAINQSGPCKAISRAVSDKRGQHYAKAGSCSATHGRDVINCLRKLPAETAGALSGGPIGLGDTAWQPVVGTSVVPKTVQAFETGEFNRVPIINGSNRDEGRLFAIGAVEQLPSAAAYEQNLRQQFGEQAPRVLVQYPIKNYPSIALAYAAYMTDWLFACPAYNANKAMSRHTPVFAYEFSDSDAPIALTPPAAIERFGAYHTAEMQYIFQTPAPDFTRPQRFTEAQIRLSDEMQAAWAQFARTGSPRLSAQRTWQPARSNAMSITNFAPTGAQLASDFEQYHQCAFWATLQAQ